MSNQINEENNTYFCYLYIKNMTEAIIGVVCFLIGTYLIYKTLKQFRWAKQSKMINKTVKVIYFILFGW